jgi:hypothetical protein
VVGLVDSGLDLNLMERDTTEFRVFQFQVFLAGGMEVGSRLLWRREAVADLGFGFGLGLRLARPVVAGSGVEVDQDQETDYCERPFDCRAAAVASAEPQTAVAHGFAFAVVVAA